MKTAIYPDKSQWNALLKRPALSNESLYDSVGQVLAQVREEGDAAVLRLEKMFDKVELKFLEIPTEMIDEAGSLISGGLKDAITAAAANIRLFHQAQMPDLQKIETTPGVTCW